TPSDDVRGISRRRAARSAPAPINRTCSPSPYFARASGGTEPRTFSDPVKIISPPIRTCRTRPAVLPPLLPTFIVLLLAPGGRRPPACDPLLRLGRPSTARGRPTRQGPPAGGSAPDPVRPVPAPLPVDLPFGVGIQCGVEPPRGAGPGKPDDREDRRENEGRQ